MSADLVKALVVNLLLFMCGVVLILVFCLISASNE